MHRILWQLLQSESSYPGNISVLKKTLMTAWMGRLRINNQPPDKKFSLAEYLLDRERIILDYSRLSIIQRKRFHHWLFSNPLTKKISTKNTWYTTEHRGFTAEEKPGWWQWLIGWFTNNNQDYFPFKHTKLPENYPLKGMQVQKADNGLLIGFDYENLTELPGKYEKNMDPDAEPSGNTKRIYLTNTLVDQLIERKVDQLDFSLLCFRSHPGSVDILDYEKRYQEMKDYRLLHGFESMPWYQQIYDWCVSWFYTPPKPLLAPGPSFEPFCTLSDSMKSIHIDHASGEIMVREPRPDLDILVFCGGGSRIYAHVGLVQAFREAGIEFTRFTGSSAGAWMSVLLYLGYTPADLVSFFNMLKKNNLMYFDMDRNGLSNTQGLKSIIDFMIVQKIDAIVKKYNIPWPDEPITFAVLDRIKRLCPKSGIGNDLLISATHMDSSESRYFSLHLTPNVEISEAVNASSCFPVVFKPVIINGEKYTDGGVLNNFPIAYGDDYSTFLEFGQGNNPRVLAVQFDNGTERQTVDKMMEKVYREDFFLNLLYQALTGVKDPASGWEADRKKLREYALQSIVIDVGNTATADFDISTNERETLYRNGYEAANEYIKAHYIETPEGFKNAEYIQERFHNFDDLLAYCCYRHNRGVFEEIVENIQHSSLKDKKKWLETAQELREIYFQKRRPRSADSFFGHCIQMPDKSSKTAINQRNYDYFRHIYPLFLVLPKEYLEKKSARNRYEKMRYSFSLTSPLYGLKEEIKEIKGKMHVLFYIAMFFMKALKAENCEKIWPVIERLTTILDKGSQLQQPQFFHQWDLDKVQCMKVLEAFSTDDEKMRDHVCKRMKMERKISVQENDALVDSPAFESVSKISL